LHQSAFGFLSNHPQDSTPAGFSTLQPAFTQFECLPSGSSDSRRAPGEGGENQVVKVQSSKTPGALRVTWMAPSTRIDENGTTGAVLQRTRGSLVLGMGIGIGE
jgi:hypothetical protein